MVSREGEWDLVKGVNGSRTLQRYEWEGVGVLLGVIVHEDTSGLVRKLGTRMSNSER